ncbi:MAG: DEAD/DEAH box helicase [Candidatus Thorarchaeota archaeon]
MSLPTRNFFIVFNQNRASKKEFNVNFFYLKKFQEDGKGFSYINEPFFKGTVQLGLDFKNKIRPLSFNKIEQDGVIFPLNPRLFKQFLVSKFTKFIAFSSKSKLEDFKHLNDMLAGFQFDKNKIISLVFCNSCLDSQKFTILNQSSQIKSFKDQILCSECAYEIVLREAKMRGLIIQERINPKLKNFFLHMLLKFKDVRKVLSVFQAEFNPVNNKEITLYDVEVKTPIGKEYLNQKFEHLDISQSLKDLLKKLNLDFLLPIQAISVKNGLLDDYTNQLIMAPTSGGKTLVGELAGISKILVNPNSKMLYLVPIVALANLRTEEFKEKYKALNLKIIKKIGESLFQQQESDVQQDLFDADIIIATYEAIDHILRSGNKDILGEINTIVVDEIQTLIDPERGYLLDGFIARLKFLYSEAQFLYLSATLGEPGLLADKLGCKLIRYNNRPVPIERHLLLCFSDAQKQKHISKLVKASFINKSKYGFKGQAIIFTNTRKKCETLTSYLIDKGINMAAYHSGLANEERKIIEENFRAQKLAGVVATAALAAGVDLPASHVIFESLAMGIKWLTVAEFEQMLGRAGRLKKHEQGYAYLLVEAGKVYSPKMKETEEEIAIKLLNGKIKDFELPIVNNKLLTELLAYISIFNQGVLKEDILKFHRLLINNDYEIDKFLKELNQLNFVLVKENQVYKSTRLGRAVAKSFLTTDQCLDILDILRRKDKSIIDIALELKPIKNVYLSKGIVADLSKNVNMRYLSNNLFSGSVLSLMKADYVKKRKSFSKEFIEFITKWISEIFNCKCDDSPYCDCGRLNLEKMILDARIIQQLSIEEICWDFEENYKIKIFKGDVIDYLENLIYSLESIKNMLEGISNIDPIYQEELKKIPKIIAKIKY